MTQQLSRATEFARLVKETIGASPTGEGFAEAHGRVFANDLRITANDTQPLRVPACDSLDDALDRFDAAIATLKPSGGGRAHGATARLARISELLREMTPHLQWSLGDEVDVFPAHLVGTYGEAEIIGETGIATSEFVQMGLSLLMPNTEYPEHSHPPEELYLVLSDGEWRQEDPESWTRQGPGGTVWNPGGIRHAMRSTGAPLFIVWCLGLRRQKHSA